MLLLAEDSKSKEIIRNLDLSARLELMILTHYGSMEVSVRLFLDEEYYNSMFKDMRGLSEFSELFYQYRLMLRSKNALMANFSKDLRSSKSDDKCNLVLP